MLIQIKAAGCLVMAVMLAGCGTQGYVESDIPGVAESLGGKAIAYNAAQRCPSYGVAYANYDRRTTRAGFIRRRIDYAFYCQ